MATKLTTKEKRKMYRVVNANGDYQQVLPETSAEQVIVDGITGLTATNVQDALTQIKDIADNGGVTGVKGEQESTYRTGDVSVSAENVGAISYAKAQSSLTDAQKTQAKTNIGLSNVANERQYSANNEPPYPVTSVNSKTGAVSLTYSDVGAVEANTAITSATHTKITYDSKGLVTGGSNLTASDIPDISATYAKKSDTDAVATRVTNIENGTTVVPKATSDASGNIITSTYATKTELTNGLAGKKNTYTYETYQAMVTAVNAMGNTAMMVGDNVMIKALNVPDLWVYKVETTSQAYTYTNDTAIITAVNSTSGLRVGYYVFAQLETTKVDLSGYQTKTDNSLTTTAKTVVGAINENKTNIGTVSGKVTTLEGSTANGAFKNSDVHAVYEFAENYNNGIFQYPTGTYANELAQAINTVVGVSIEGLCGDPADVSNDLAVAKAKSLAYPQVVGAERSGQQQDIVVNLKEFDNGVDRNTTNVWNIDGKKNHAYAIGAELSDTGVTAGTYGSVTVDAKGRVTAGSNPSVPVAGSDAVGGILSGGDVTVGSTGSVTVNKATELRNSRNFSISGDVTTSAVSFNGTGNVTLNATLASVGTAGTYTAVTTDAKGRVTAGGNAIEWGTSSNNSPSANLMVGGIFMEYQA